MKCTNAAPCLYGLSHYWSVPHFTALFRCECRRLGVRELYRRSPWIVLKAALVVWKNLLACLQLFASSFLLFKVHWIVLDVMRYFSRTCRHTIVLGSSRICCVFFFWFPCVLMISKAINHRVTNQSRLTMCVQGQIFKKRHCIAW